MDKREALGKVSKYKNLLQEHFDIDSVYLYGSFAKGNFNKDSDIDVAIVVSQLSGDYFNTTPLIWKLRRQIDDRIEPILIERCNDKAGFLEEIEKTGIKVN